MPEDLYADDAGGTPGPPDATETPPGGEPKEPEQQEDATEAVLPKSILAGKEFNVGDEVVLKITAIHDNQISVKYAPAKEGTKDEEAGESAETEAAEMPKGMPKAGMMGGGGEEYD